MIPPKRFDIFSPLTGGCSEGLGTFRFFFEHTYIHTNGGDLGGKKKLRQERVGSLSANPDNLENLDIIKYQGNREETQGKAPKA